MLTVEETITDDDQDVDTLVPDPQVQREFGITSMTLWRWTNDPLLGFPPPIKIQNRNYRSRRQLEVLKRHLLTEAIKARKADDNTAE